VDSPVAQSTITFIGVSVIFFSFLLASHYEVVTIPSLPLVIPYKLIVEPMAKVPPPEVIASDVIAVLLE